VGNKGQLSGGLIQQVTKEEREKGKRLKKSPKKEKGIVCERERRSNPIGVR